MMKICHVVQIVIDRYVLRVKNLCSEELCKSLQINCLCSFKLSHFQVRKSEGTVSSPMNDYLEEKGSKRSSGLSRKKGKSFQSESASSNAKNISESSDSENETRQDDTCSHDPISSKTKVAGKSGTPKRNSKRVAERVLVCMQKRQKKTMASDSDSIVDGGLCASDTKLRSNSCKDNEDTSSSSQKNLKSSTSGRSRRESPLKDSNKVVQGEVVDGSLNEMITDPPATSSDDNLRKEEHVDENIYKQECSDDKTWKTIETSLFEKGIEIFGKNRLVYFCVENHHVF